MPKPLPRSGYLTLHALVYGAIGLLIISALVGWGAAVYRSARQFANREQAFQVAEAGIEYYRWHLAHAPQDFKDGGSAAGPYVHNFYDKNGDQLGTFSLTITPPPIGSTVVKIVSEGRVLVDPSLKRSIEAVLAIPSLAKYAVAANDEIRFGQGTEVFGPIYSKYGIRFDGLAHNVISSAKSDYDDPDHSGANEFAVHTHVNPPPGSGIDDSFRAAEAPPNTVSSRPDVFMVGRQLGVPELNWDGFTTDLTNIKNATQANYLFPSSSASGYLLVLNPDDSFDLFKVTSLLAVPNDCDPASQTGWGSWSVGTTQPYPSVGNNHFTFPSNGLVFFQDNVWVEGQINGGRLTIAAAKASTGSDKNITVNHDLRYAHYDGQDILGLIAEGNINVGMDSNDQLRIDAALIAKNGRVGRYYYESPGCGTYSFRNTINLYGMIATSQRYGFAYTDGNGYQTRNITYDGNLLFGPPPSFPLTTDQYQVMSWREL